MRCIASVFCAFFLALFSHSFLSFELSAHYWQHNLIPILSESATMTRTTTTMAPTVKMRTNAMTTAMTTATTMATTTRQPQLQPQPQNPL